MLKIGDFSRMARVTIKTLRFYDDAGLFRPAFVDPRSGYRFYLADQLAELQRVRLLRDLGFSVAEVRKLMSSPIDAPEYARLVAAQRKRLAVRVARDEQRLRQLDFLRHAHKGKMECDRLQVTEIRIEPVTALTLRDRVRSLGADVERMFEATEQQVGRYDCRASLSPFLLFHDMEYHGTHVDVEVCVPIAPESAASCGGRVVEGVERAACVRFAGSYDQAPPLYDLMLEWMDRVGARIAGAPREMYLRFGADQRGYKLSPLFIANGVHEYQTELQIPIASV